MSKTLLLLALAGCWSTAEADPKVTSPRPGPYDAPPIFDDRARAEFSIEDDPVQVTPDRIFIRWNEYDRASPWNQLVAALGKPTGGSCWHICWWGERARLTSYRTRVKNDRILELVTRR